MIRIISALLLGISSFCALAQDSATLQLNPTAPERYTVVKGDTLWGISGQYLAQPWHWPQLWRMNQSTVKNPHRIYPGQVLVLDRSSGQPYLRLEDAKLSPRVYEEKLDQAIPSIPSHAIEPFLSKPNIVAEDGLKDAPRIVATQEDHVFIGPGGKVYVSGLTAQDPAQVWQVFRPAKPVVDPENGETIGHEAFYLGTARKIADGDPATVEIITAVREIGVNDRLLPAAGLEVINYAPHIPSAKFTGRVAAIYGGVNEAGRHSIITLNRGTRDGLEVGHVLAIYRHGAEREVREGTQTTRVQLPNERYGLVFVFRTFERISYALVMDVSRPVVVGDLVRTP